ncbi:toprim domain-containing protein [Arenibacter sp. F20364]|uniref:toprim domain-containing protein n=1 Tax=Arenibacter sp. F20364 TaxID=2926415 RepID=UPI001FF102B6|nr:toprim domain-containing protein [Arenibacter sp. F20364]MCK0190461.1 toprim domain-containing protein [Arenibacter sp. F20364]
MQRTNKISCERARDYPIGKALANLGHFPTKESKKEAWFLSPFRSETQASFKVSKKLNRWYDHGAGKGGNVIDLICLINGTSVKETLAWLQKGQISFSFQQQPLFTMQNGNDIQVRYAQPITHFALIGYLHARKISLSTAVKLCQEVHYIFRGRDYFAIGLQNSSGGWELRNKYYKNSSSPKDITHIKNENNRLIVTEGMFDILSLMDMGNNLMEKNDLLILNSLGFIEKSFDMFDAYKSVALYMDNDRAGKKAVDLMLKENPKCKDRSNLYKDFKDVNAWWTAQNQ